MHTNSICARVKLHDKAPEGEEVELQIDLDTESGQLSILKDGMYFAHLYVGADLKLKISYPDLIGDKEFNHGEVAEIDLDEVLKCRGIPI